MTDLWSIEIGIAWLCLDIAMMIVSYDGGAGVHIAGGDAPGWRGGARVGLSVDNTAGTWKHSLNIEHLL